MELKNMNDKAWHGARTAVSMAAAVVSALCLTAVTSCSDWTVPESLGIDSPGLGQQYPELYARYLENLKEYKAGSHKLSVGWFDNSASVPSGQADRLTALPDSLDAVVLMYPDMVEAWELDEMASVRSTKGTKVLYRIDYASASGTSETGESADGAAEMTSDEAAAEISSWMDRILPMCEENGFDGISVWYDPLELSHLEDASREYETARQTAFETAVSAWIAANPDKMLILESNYPYLISEGSIVENADLIAVHTEDSESIYDVETKVRNLIMEGIPSDRFLVLADAGSSSVPGSGYINDADGQSVDAISETAWMVTEPAEGMTLSGLGITSIRNAYFNADLSYAQVRRAISIMNPTSNR